METPIQYRWQLTGRLNQNLLLNEDWGHDNLKLEPFKAEDYSGIKITFSHVNYDESREKAREEAIAKIEEFLKIWSFNRGYRIKLTEEKLDLVNEEEVSIQRGYKTGAVYLMANVRVADRTTKNKLNDIIQLNETITKNSNMSSLRMCIDWYVGSLEHKDPSDKFLAIWIAFNIMYNLYDALINPSHRDEYNDRKKVIGIRALFDSTSLMKQHINMPDLIEVFNNYNISSRRGGTIVRHNMNLQQTYEQGKYKEALKNLLECLYKIRCNLFHGAKGRDDFRQEILLTRCYGVLQLLVKEAFLAYILKTE